MIFSFVDPSTIGFPLVAGGFGNSPAVLWSYSPNFPGVCFTTDPRWIQLSGEEDSVIAAGMDGGFALISSTGQLNLSLSTTGPVVAFDVLDDLDGDGRRDIIIAIDDQSHPNVLALSSSTGLILWRFTPSVEAVDPNSFVKVNQITRPWSVRDVGDITGDGIKDVLVASWHILYLLDGMDGAIEWKNAIEFSDDIWYIANFTIAGTPVIVGGSEDGRLAVIDARSGISVWSKIISRVSIPSLFGFSNKWVDKPNSIDAITVIDDVDNDATVDLLVTVDDGFLYLVSGKTGSILDREEVYAVAWPTPSIPYIGVPPSSAYSPEERIYQHFGLTLTEMPDYTSDGRREFFTLGRGLDYVYEIQGSSQEGRLISVNPASPSDYLKVELLFGWNETEYVSPLLVEVVPDTFRLIYVLSGPIERKVAYINLFGNNPQGEARVIYSEQLDSDYPTPDYGSSYLLPPQTGSPDVGYCGRFGRCVMLSTRTGDLRWEIDLSQDESTVEEFRDVNGNGRAELLFSSTAVFNPEWYENDVSEEVTTHLAVLDAITGVPLWHFDPENYMEGCQGLHGLTETGDVDGDLVPDFAAWVIPARIPDMVKDYLRSISGNSTITGTSNTQAEKIYRILLANFTRFLSISGKTGEILWDESLITNPYRFLRHSEMAGTYTSPVPIQLGNYQFVNRIPGLMDMSWYSRPLGDDFNYSIFWNRSWDWSLLQHAEDVAFISGTNLEGSLLDIQGMQGHLYGRIGTNASPSVAMGIPLNETADGTGVLGDSRVWVVDSEGDNGQFKLQAEMAYYPGANEFDNVFVYYRGWFSKILSRVSLFAYNYSAPTEHWVLLSMLGINISGPSSGLVIPLDKTFFADGDNNNQVRLKLEAEDPSWFNLSLDALYINYTRLDGNYTLESANGAGQWSTVLDFDVNSGLTNVTNAGAMETGLTERERFSALKLQTSITVNETVAGLKFSYYLFNYSSSTWVECNWTGSRIWQVDHPSLHGNYSQPVDGGYRNTFDDFSFAQNSFRDDVLYLITRGTNDADPVVSFDFENATSLSCFLNGTGNLKIRLNVTAAAPFKAIMDSFGAGVFMWGLTSPAFDSYYIFDQDEGGKFSTTHLVDTRIQDFQAINGTGRASLDILAVVGLELLADAPQFSASLTLFDVQAQQKHVRWDVNRTRFPFDIISVTQLNSTQNAWLLSGAWAYGSKNNYTHRIVSNHDWSISVSPLANYTGEMPAFTWRNQINISSAIPGDYFVETPRAITVNTANQTGIVLGVYDGAMLNSLRVVNPDTGTSFSRIPIDNIVVLKGTWSLLPNFRRDGAGFQLLLGYEDFNGDGYLDHVGLMESGFSSITDIIVVYSGASGNSPILLGQKTFTNMGVGNNNKEQVVVPLFSAGDLNGDAYPEAFIGLQTYSGLSISCRGASLTCFAIQSGFNEITEYSTTFENFTCPSFGYSQAYQFFGWSSSLMDMTGDGKSELAVTHLHWFNTTAAFSPAETITEIVDVIKHTPLLRFTSKIDAVSYLPDVTGDYLDDITFVRGGRVYCINSQFRTNVTNIQDNEVLTTRDFTLTWDGFQDRRGFDIVVDGIVYGRTNATSMLMSLGSGPHKIQVCMHDPSDLFMVFSERTVLVPQDYTTYIIAGISLGVIVIAGVMLNIYHRKQRSLVLIPPIKVSFVPKISRIYAGAPVIETFHLSKVYPGKGRNPPTTAVDNIDLSIMPGAHGFLGPNGAGKTSTINMLVGALSITDGSAKILGRPAGSLEARKLLGFLPQDPSFPEDLTAEEYLILMGRLGSLSSKASRVCAQELLIYLDLFDDRSKIIKQYSGGMKQKLGLAAALIHHPAVLILDEPTANLDPQGRADIIRIVKDLAKSAAIFVSSHILAEVEQMCNHVTVINKGRIIAAGSVTDIKRKYSGINLVVDTNDNPRLLQGISTMEGVAKAWMEQADGKVYVQPVSPDFVLHLQQVIPGYVIGQGLTLLSFTKPEVSLQDAFFEILGMDGKSKGGVTKK